MGSVSGGIKSGVIAGIAYGVIVAIIGVIAIMSLKAEILSSIGTYLSKYPTLKVTAEEIYNLAVVITPIAGIVEGIIGGLIFGAIFGVVEHRLPGSTPKIKGIIFGIFLWIVFSLLFGLLNLAEYGFEYYGLSAAGGLIAAVVYGFVLGVLYGRFVPSSETTQS